MGADPEHGRRRPCSRSDCHVPNTRAQEREHVRRDIESGLDDNHRNLLEDALNPGRVEPMTEYELDLAVRRVPPAAETSKGRGRRGR